MPRLQSSHRMTTEPGVSGGRLGGRLGGHLGAGGGRGNAHRAAALNGRALTPGDDATFDWLDFDPAEMDQARTPLGDAATGSSAPETIDAGPSEAERTAQQTADAEAHASEADQTLVEGEPTLAEATEAQAAASEALAATEARTEEAEQAAEAAEAAQAVEAAAAGDLPVVGEDITLADALEDNPNVLGLMGLDAYAGRPEIAAAAATAMRRGDWKILQEAGLSEDEAKALFDTVEAVRIGVENSSHVVDFAEGTVVDDQVGRDEIVIPGVSSWDDLDQTREGDDLLLETADGSVRVVGYFDTSRRNVARIRLADAESDNHEDTTLYRDEMLHVQEQAGVGDEAVAAGEAVAIHMPQRFPGGPITDRQKALADTRNRAMYDWGTSQTEDVRTLMFGASNRDHSQLVRGHNKVLGKYAASERAIDPRETMEDLWTEGYDDGRRFDATDRDGASAIAQSDRALQDLAYFSTLDAGGQQDYVKHIAKKGEKKSGFFGKVLGLIATVVSFINPVIGAILQGVSVVAQGGSILDGIKAGLSALMAGGALGGGATTRIAGTALATDGDPAAIALAAAGAVLDQSPLGDVLSENQITIDGDGINVGVGDTPLAFGVNSSLDFGGSVTVEQGSIDFRDGGQVTVTIQHGDYRGSITDEGAVTLQQNLADHMAGDATTWGGFSVNADGDVSLVLDQSRQGDDGFTTITSGIIDLQTGEATTTVTNDATLADVLDQYRNGTSPYLLPVLPDVQTGDPEVIDIDSTVDITGDLYEEPGDLAPPEQDEYLDEIMDKIDAVAPAGEMEEVVVTAPYIGQGTPMTTTPGRTDDDRATDGPAPGESGTSTQDDLDEAKEDVAKAALALAELGGSAVAASGNELVDLQEAAEKIQKALDDPTPANIMEAQAAVNKVLGNLAELVKHPDSAIAKKFAAIAGVAANLVVFTDESQPLNDRVRAAVSIVGAMGGPGAKRASELFLATNDLGGALYTFGNSAGAVDPDTGLTPFQETANEALAVELAARAQGDAYEAAIRDTGAATATALAEVTGLDVADEVGAVFDAIGSQTGSLFDGVGHAAAVTHVVTSALGDALEGSIRAAVGRFRG